MSLRRMFLSYLIGAAFLMTMAACAINGDHFFSATDWSALWNMNANDYGAFNDDGSGSPLSIDTNNYIGGRLVSNSIQVGIPTNDVEAKIKGVLSVDQANLWSGKNKVLADVYVPADCNVNECFLYIFESGNLTENNTTNWYIWIDGVPATGLKPGWNQVLFPLPYHMKYLKTSRQYSVGLTFFSMISGGVQKVKINRPVSVNGIWVSY